MYVGELNSGDSTTRGTWGQQTSETGRSLTRRSPPEHLMEGGMQPFRMGGAEFSLERRATKNHSLQCPNRNAICGWAAAGVYFRDGSGGRGHPSGTQAPEAAVGGPPRVDRVNMAVRRWQGSPRRRCRRVGHMGCHPKTRGSSSPAMYIRPQEGNIS
jgi:hypothetical protein